MWFVLLHSIAATLFGSKMKSFRYIDIEELLASYSEFIQSKECLEKIYNAESKLTIGTNSFVGVDKIAQYLKREAKDFQYTSFTALPYDDHTVVVTGKCIWANSKKIFTFVFQEKDCNISIVNQIIN